MGNHLHLTDTGESQEAAVVGVHLGTVLSEASFPQVGSPSLTLGGMFKYVLDKRGYTPRASCDFD